MGTELAILWYRGFHDVPRMFCVRLNDAYLVFESAFSDELDEYEDTFAIKRVVEPGELSADEILERAASLEVVARVLVNQELFDPTGRVRVRLPAELVTALR